MSEQEQALEITEESAGKLTDEERAAKIQQLKDYEDSIKTGISNPGSIIHEMVFSSERVIFQRWATALEQLHFLGKYEDPITTISTYIKKQIGRMEIELNKKENLYRNVERSIDQRFKEPRSDRQNVAENTSAFSKAADGFLYKRILDFAHFHYEMGDIGIRMLKHFDNPEYGDKLYHDFEGTIEWREISIFCATLAALTEPIRKIRQFKDDLDEALAEYSTLKHIGEYINLKESADIFRRCMFILKNDNMFRQMAHKFGVSPRQNQRIRERMAHWPKKEARIVIQKVLGTYKCGNCGYDIITKRKSIDITDEKFKIYRFNDMGLRPDLKIPKGIKLLCDDIKGLNPIEIAEKVWAKKIKLYPDR